MIATAEPVFYARTDAQRDEAYRRRLPGVVTPVLVVSNGSGQMLDLDALFEALTAHTLDPKFRRYGNFRLEDDRRPGIMQFWGNFWNISHVFSVFCVAGSEAARRLDAAIEANLATPAYAAACIEDDNYQAGRAEREAAESRRRTR